LIAGQLDEEQLPAFAGNAELQAALAGAIDDGLPTLAMGGGALLLLRRLADSRGRSHELAGVVPAEAELLEWYERPRYVSARASRGNPFDEGESLLYELFDLEFLLLEQESFAYHVGDADEPGQAEGFVVGRCLATTLYPSLPQRPALAAGFVAAMRLAGPRVSQLREPCICLPGAPSSGWPPRRWRRLPWPRWRCTSSASPEAMTRRTSTSSPSCATASR
jgi:cobyrinic acid a,c-diamide synthase